MVALHRAAFLGDQHFRRILTHPASARRAQRLLTDVLTMPKEEAYDKWGRSTGQEGAFAGGFFMGLCQLQPGQIAPPTTTGGAGGGLGGTGGAGGAAGGAPTPLHRRMDLRCFDESEEPFALLHLTGSAGFNRYLSRVALAQGFSLSEKGLRAARREAGTMIPNGPYVPTDGHGQPWRIEAQIFDFLGITYVEPADRDGKFSIRRAGTGLLYFTGHAEDSDGDGGEVPELSHGGGHGGSYGALPDDGGDGQYAALRSPARPSPSGSGRGSPARSAHGSPFGDKGRGGKGKGGGKGGDKGKPGRWAKSCPQNT